MKCSRCNGSGVEPPDAGTFLSVESSARLSFELFWEEYPRKIARKTALVSWQRMTGEQQADAIRALPWHVRMWAHEGRGTRLIPHASTWLNQERWTDDLSGYVDDAPRKQMPGRAGIEAALARTQQKQIGDGS